MHASNKCIMLSFWYPEYIIWQMFAFHILRSTFFWYWWLLLKWKHVLREYNLIKPGAHMNIKLNSLLQDFLHSNVKRMWNSAMHLKKQGLMIVEQPWRYWLESPLCFQWSSLLMYTPRCKWLLKHIGPHVGESRGYQALSFVLAKSYVFSFEG